MAGWKVEWCVFFFIEEVPVVLLETYRAQRLSADPEMVSVANILLLSEGAVALGCLETLLQLKN